MGVPWTPDARARAVELSDFDRDTLEKILFLGRRGYLGSNAVLMPFYAYHEDSLDADTTATFKFWLPRATVQVVEMGLRFALLPYRYYAAAGASEGTTATGVTVTINGTDRTAALGGGTGFTVGKNWLDVATSGWLTFGAADADCLNTIVLTSTQNGRIRAQVDGLVMRSLGQ